MAVSYDIFDLFRFYIKQSAIYTAGFFLPGSYCPDIICHSLVEDLEMNKAKN